MTIKLTERLIDNLQQLIDMKRVSYSAFPQSVRDILLEDGLVVVENRGTRRYVRVISIEALKGALPRYNEALRDLEAARASLSGNSKTRGQRSCPGFLVNAYDRLDCMLGGRPFAIDPSQGSAVYIADWESFTPPPSVLIVSAFRRLRPLWDKNLSYTIQAVCRRERLVSDTFRHRKPSEPWIATAVRRPISELRDPFNRRRGIERSDKTDP